MLFEIVLNQSHEDKETRKIEIICYLETGVEKMRDGRR